MAEAGDDKLKVLLAVSDALDAAGIRATFSKATEFAYHVDGREEIGVEVKISFPRGAVEKIA